MSSERTGVSAFLKSRKRPSDPTMEILTALSEGPLSMADLVAGTSIPLGAVIKMVTDMTATGLVKIEDDVIGLTSAGKTTLGVLANR